MIRGTAGRGARQKRYSSERPHPVDIHVGGRVRLRRTMLGMSQEKLGESLGLTFQQIQKYERGTNRIGSSRLFELSKVLDVPISFFFEEMAPAIVGRSRTRGPVGLSDAGGPAYETETLARRETLELMRNYYRIPDSAVRRRVFELVKSLAKSAGTPAR